MEHHCHARGCPTVTKPEMLMCRKHWYMVPAKLQKEVWKHYRVGQCDDMNPSKEWHVAADAAIAFVAEKERKAIKVTTVDVANADQMVTDTLQAKRRL